MWVPLCVHLVVCCVESEFGFDAPGALAPGTPTSHEVWKAFFLKKKRKEFTNDINPWN